MAPRSTKSGKWSISQFNLSEDQRQPWLGLCVRNLGENVHSGSLSPRAGFGVSFYGVLHFAAAGRYSGYATANSAMRALSVLWNYAAERDPTLPA